MGVDGGGGGDVGVAEEDTHGFEVDTAFEHGGGGAVAQRVDVDMPQPRITSWPGETPAVETAETPITAREEDFVAFLSKTLSAARRQKGTGYDMAMDEPEPTILISQQEAARLLGVERTTVWRLIKRGDLKQVSLGRRLLVVRASLNELIERRVGTAS